MMALVTGAGSGIGREVCTKLARRGTPVALLDRDVTNLQTAVAELSAFGIPAMSFVADVGSVREVQCAIESAEAALGQLSVVVNAAGINVRTGLLETSMEDWERVIRVNLTGCFNIVRSAVPFMQSNGGGAIVLVASSAAHRGGRGHGNPAYTASKGGVLAMTRQLAGELAPHDIRINSVSPGPVVTGLNRDYLATEASRSTLLAGIPLGRYGEASEVAALVDFLCGPDSSFITGADFVVDGGFISRCC